MITLLVALQASAWPVHAMDRPRPPIVTPAPAGAAVPAPTHAHVVFDGASLDAWWHVDSSAARWRAVDGVLEVVPGARSLQTRAEFGDVQLHIEWMAPTEGRDGQNFGNSGVFLMGRYEIQVLNSHGNDTYPDGQAAAIYGQYPPLVNVSRPPGQWQTYDIIFRAPRFHADGTVADSAVMTVFHNGVLVHDAVRLRGATTHRRQAEYAPHPPRGPIMLQDHGERVRFRNIWVREVP
ncbi:MAG: DUF1080 domain-containing protein [Gemmatimonadales bacterium]